MSGLETKKGRKDPTLSAVGLDTDSVTNFGTKGHAKCRRTSTAVIAEEILVRGSDKTPAYI